MNFYASCGLLSFAESYYLMELVCRHPFFFEEMQMLNRPTSTSSNAQTFLYSSDQWQRVFLAMFGNPNATFTPLANTMTVVSSAKFALKFLNYRGTVRNKDCPLSDWCAARAYKAILALVERDSGRSWKQQQRLHQVQA